MRSTTAILFVLACSCSGSSASIPDGAPNATPTSPVPPEATGGGGGGGPKATHAASLFVASCASGDVSTVCSPSLVALDATPRAHATKLPDVSMALEPGGLP